MSHKKILSCGILAWTLLASCTYSPNYSKVDASDHSVTNYHYSARQMAVGVPNQAGDSMVSTTYEDEENATSPTTSTQAVRFYKPVPTVQPPSSFPDSQKFDTSYIFPNPFVAIFGIFANAIKNFNDRMEYIATHPYNASRGSYVYQPPSYATAYQQSLYRHGIYGARNSAEAQAYACTAQALSGN